MGDGFGGVGRLAPEHRFPAGIEDAYTAGTPRCSARATGEPRRCRRARGRATWRASDRVAGTGVSGGRRRDQPGLPSRSSNPGCLDPVRKVIQKERPRPRKPSSGDRFEAGSDELRMNHRLVAVDATGAVLCDLKSDQTIEI